MVQYVSTRGPGPTHNFLDVMMAGMAPDGGLYLPTEWPALNPSLLDHMAGLSYPEIAFHVIRPFVGGTIPDDVLIQILSETYTPDHFDHTAYTPLHQVEPNAWVM